MKGFKWSNPDVGHGGRRFRKCFELRTYIREIVVGSKRVRGSVKSVID